MELNLNPKDYLRVEEVALRLGVSVKTIQNWYSFKRHNPNNEYAKILPEYSQITLRGTRLWYKDDLWKLAEFKALIPHGHNGIMGSVTQKYYRNRKDKTSNG